MSISFNQIPANVLTPFTFVEFDNTNATRNLEGKQPYSILVLGQKLESGQAETGRLYRVLDTSAAERLFGPSSMLHHMFSALKQNNSESETWAIALAEPGEPVSVSIESAEAETDYEITLSSDSSTVNATYTTGENPTEDEILEGLRQALSGLEEVKSVSSSEGRLSILAEDGWEISLSVGLSEEESASNKADGRIDLKGVAEADGTLSLHIGGIPYVIAVKREDKASDVAPRLIEAVNDNPLSFVEAEIEGNNDVVLTAKQDGLAAGAIPIVFNYNEFDLFPVGLERLEVTQLSGGGVNPSVETALEEIGEIQFNVIAMPYTDTNSLRALDRFLEDRWGPNTPWDGHGIAVRSDTPENLIDLAESVNSRQITVMDGMNSPVPAYMFAAALAGLNSSYASRDPARPQQTLEIKGVLPGANTRKREVRDQLLKAGISTHTSRNNKAYVERLVTTYTRNPIGSLDVSYRDLAVKQTLSFLRWDFRRLFANRYPRHKLAISDERLGAGQAVLTPKAAKAEAVALFRQWELSGLVEDIDQYKRELVVQISLSDPNRLEFLMSPNLINQLRVIGAQISYIL